MSKEIIYLKEINKFDDILKKEHKKIPSLLKKIIFMFKNIFNIVTKKHINDCNIWILPIKEKYSINKIDSIIRKQLINTNCKFVISNELLTKEVISILDKYNIEYINEEKIKKLLLLDILKYVAKFQKKEISQLEITMLVNSNSEINLFLIEEISKMVKSLKIVSLNIYKFKKLEEKMYNEYGIAIQFSNSCKKSLEKSNIIVNLDFNEIELNEYNIYSNAIIINCNKQDLKVKTRLFEGIIINSLEISFKRELVEKFKKISIYNEYNKLLLYASVIEKEKDIMNIYKQIEEDKVIITNIIGNNGYINKNEFKNINKRLDKNKKTE